MQSSTNTLNGNAAAGGGGEVNSQEEHSHRESLTSLVETSLVAKPFSRDQPGRQSMSEKRHATLDAKNTDTYQKRKKAREDRDKQQRLEQQQRMWKKSASLESLHLQSGGASVFGDGHEVAASSERDALRSAYVRANSVGVSRNRGCNESFRAAVDRSYEQQQQQQRHLPVDCENHSGFVIQDLDSPAAPIAVPESSGPQPPLASNNDENLSGNASSKVVRREKTLTSTAEKMDKKSNRNSRLLTGLSNMFKSSSGGAAGGSKPKSSSHQQLQQSSSTSGGQVKVPAGSSSSNMSSSKSAHNLSSESSEQLRAQWHAHHMKLHQMASSSQHRSSSMPRHPVAHPSTSSAGTQESYEYLPGMMRPGSRVGIAADLGSTPDYDVIQRLQQRPAPPPPPPQAQHYQVYGGPVYAGAPPPIPPAHAAMYGQVSGAGMHPHPPHPHLHHQMGIPAPSSRQVHMRTSSNLSSGGSSSGGGGGGTGGHLSSSSLQSASGRSHHHHLQQQQPSHQQPPMRHRPKSNFYEYDYYAPGGAVATSSGGGAPPPPPPEMRSHLPVNHQQKIMMQQQQSQQPQQMYSLPRMQQTYFQSDYN